MQNWKFVDRKIKGDVKNHENPNDPHRSPSTFIAPIERWGLNILVHRIKGKTQSAAINRPNWSEVNMVNKPEILQLICSVSFEIDRVINERLKKMPQLNVFDYKTNVYEVLDQEYSTIPQWVSLENILDVEPVFHEGKTKLGSIGSPRQFIKHIIFHSLRDVEGNIRSAAFLAYKTFNELIWILENNVVEYIGCVRLLGIELESNMSLSDDMSVVNITTEDIKDREQVFESSLGYFDNPIEHNTELQIRIKVPIDPNQEGSVIQSSFTGLEILEELVTDFLTALYLLKQGEILIGTKVLYGGIFDRLTTVRDLTRNMLNKSVILGQDDAENLYSLYSLVNNSKSDKILRRSLNRFVMGRARSSHEDRIVDYAICLESLLLTDNGKATSGELSYRFRLNGSSLMKIISPSSVGRDAYNFMKHVYEVRSKIVHGESDESIIKIVKKAGFNSLMEFCQTLDATIREIIVWLLSMDQHQRPYIKQGAWEDLLWNTES